MRQPGSTTLSIAIPSWNTRDLLDQCLSSLYDTMSGADFEVIVIDNGSHDGSPDMVETKYPQAQVIRNPHNLGFAAACNLGFKYSTGRYFLLLNSDTIVLDGAIRRMLAFMETHPDAGLSGCRLLNGDGSLQRSCSKFPNLLTELYDALYLSKIFPRSRVFGSYAMTYWDFKETREVDFAGGSCLIARREAIEEVGLLDEGYFMYTEEADWCYRMWERNWKVYFYPGAEIIHLGGQSARRYGSDILLQLYVSRNRFLRKHSGNLTAAVHKLVVGLGALLRVIGFRLRGLLGPDQSDAVRFHGKLLRWAVGGRFARGIGADPRCVT